LDAVLHGDLAVILQVCKTAAQNKRRPAEQSAGRLSSMVAGQDLNLRPSGDDPDELPGCVWAGGHLLGKSPLELSDASPALAAALSTRNASRFGRNRFATAATASGSVVELVGTHEVAYLEHCRRYALPREWRG
jgi:hypothetical protein